MKLDEDEDSFIQKLFETTFIRQNKPTKLHQTKQTSSQSTSPTFYRVYSRMIWSRKSLLLSHVGRNEVSGRGLFFKIYTTSLQWFRERRMWSKLFGKPDPADNVNDPCYPQMQGYLKCVEGHKDGLTEGDDCQPETVLYKKCREEQKVQLKKKKTPPEK